MRSALAALTGAVLMAGIAGGGGSAPRRVVLGADFTGGVEVSKPKGTAVVPVAASITSLHWETNTVGVGAGNYTLSALVEGVAVCTVERACTATGSATQECTASASAGEDVHVTITASTCDTLPLGVASLWLALER